MHEPVTDGVLVGLVDDTSVDREAVHRPLALGDQRVATTRATFLVDVSTADRTTLFPGLLRPLR